MQENHHKDSQQESPDDSGLQTPQPDQRLPTEAERAEKSEGERVTERTEKLEVTEETVDK